ncbi:uncharacterized protein LOC121693734 [Alosa sapidissima]|uniref:uncharacterized protein LOC121693734 n=1 Tax=Alosa sapidissima TaxID=34773 RepID=UPI001C096962|nr:uncharacterized protein LOC121693734 [Alosa sapidissima]XP_041929307.1 uncharacterized protein LOC121693734 [Alosa sapidissima]
MEIAKTSQSLTTASEMRETTQMLMQPNANWEEYLTPAPLSIAIMGELVFISSGDDFSINPSKTDSKDSPQKPFEYIKYPDSFRACLMQVCNSGWHAFNEAHKNMDQIRIHTSTVPVYMKAAVKILFKGNDDVIKTLLPNQLENIRTIADECVTLADSVEKKYMDVINLIQELLAACVNAECIYGDELDKVKMKLREAETKEKTARELTKRSEKAFEAMSKQLEEAQAGFMSSMDSLPTGWDMIGMDFVEGLTSGITRLLNPQKTSVMEKSDDKNPDEITLMTVYSKSGEILSYAGSLSEFVKESGIDWKELYDQKTKSTKTKWTQSQFERIYEDLKKLSDCNPVKKALALCEKGIAICAEIAKYDPEKKWDENITQKLIIDVKKVNDDARTFDSESKATSGSPALTPKPPMMYKAESTSGQRQSASQRASDNAHFRIEQSRQQLQQACELYEKRMENMEKNEKELNEILIEMQNCKIKEIDFNTKIEMLVKGLDAMGRVKEQWEKMVRFFQMVSNIVKASLSQKLHSFVKTSEDIKKLAYNEKLFAKDLLYNYAFQASNIASLVHMISGTYTEVSSKYLMDKVSSLGKLMAMDKSNPEFMQERLKLQQSCKAAQDGILQLVQKNKKEFERKTDTRMEKIESGLKAVLPEASPEETKRIREIVQAGFKDGGNVDEEENYY